MKKNYQLFSILVLFIMLVFSSTAAYATNGYFADGYGVGDQAMAGAGVALPQDALDAAVNPANMVFLGKRYDLGISFFNPNRQYTVNGNPSGFPGTFGLTPGTVHSDEKWFVIPAFGANWMIDQNSSVGLSIYGNGGMNTDYPAQTFYGSSPTGVDLMQLFITPTYARKIDGAPQHAIGVSPIFAIQRFMARGLQQFDNPFFSSSPGNVTNNGYDYAYGIGARIGYQGEIVPNVLNLGISYQTRVYMTTFGKYRGLFADNGNFDIPSNWTVGVAIKPMPALVFLFDVQRIQYSEIHSIGNPMLPNLQTAQLGNDNGAGFGWHDMMVYRFGVQWKSSEAWTWRAGYSTGNEPIRDSDVLFNILAPGVIQEHVTAGFSVATAKDQDLSVAVTRALSNSVTGANPLEVPGQQSITLKMDQWQIALGYAWKF
jgi:long-chain fatty acid transport protein